MTADPLDFARDLQAASDQLIATAATLDDAALAAPSRLPGWTRGHVLAHVARNADGAVNLLTWARTGVVTEQYASLDARAADIEAGSGRTAEEQLADVRATTHRLAEAVDAMPPEAWAAEVRWADGRVSPAAMVMWRRLREVELHHVDLDAGYTPDDWPEAFAIRLVTELARLGRPLIELDCAEVGHPLTLGDGGPVVSGPVRAAGAWLTGRGDGTGLTGPLPEVPPLG